MKNLFKQTTEPEQFFGYKCPQCNSSIEAKPGENLVCSNCQAKLAKWLAIVNRWEIKIR